MGNKTDGRRNFIMQDGTTILNEQIRHQIFCDDVRRVQSPRYVSADKHKAKRKGVSRSPPQSCFQSCEGLEREIDAKVSFRRTVDGANTSGHSGSELYEYGAYAFLYEGERGKARRYSLKGLELNPNHWGCVLSFARAARKAQWPEVRALIEATDESHACYEWMISTLIEFGEYPLARQLVEYMAKETPDCENLPYFREYLGMGEEG